MLWVDFGTRLPYPLFMDTQSHTAATTTVTAETVVTGAHYRVPAGSHHPGVSPSDVLVGLMGTGEGVFGNLETECGQSIPLSLVRRTYDTGLQADDIVMGEDYRIVESDYYNCELAGTVIRAKRLSGDRLDVWSDEGHCVPCSRLEPIH